MSNRRNALAYIASASVGLIVCLAISIVTQQKEAFDSPTYFLVGIPIMCLSIFAISYKFPEKPWRWTLSMAAGQSLVLGGNSMSLWPLAIVAMAVLSIPQLLSGALASKLTGSRLTKTQENKSL